MDFLDGSELSTQPRRALAGGAFFLAFRSLPSSAAHAYNYPPFRLRIMSLRRLPCGFLPWGW